VYASFSSVPGNVKQEYDCSNALVSASSEYQIAKGRVNSAGCSITLDSGVLCKIFGNTVGCEGAGASSVTWALGGTDNGDACRNIIGYGEAQGSFHGEHSYSCEILPPSVECPSNSSKDVDLGNVCNCNSGTVSYNGTTCENIKPDPCPPFVDECNDRCLKDGGADVIQCQSSDGQFVGVPYCHCKGLDDLSKKGKCDPDSGTNCATADRQDKGLDEQKKTTTAVSNGATTIKDAIDSSKDKAHSDASDIKGLLTDIKNSPGILSSGGGAGDNTASEDKPSNWGGATFNYSDVPTFAGKLELSTQELNIKKEILSEKLTTFSNIGSTIIHPFSGAGGGSCPHLDFSGTILSNVSGSFCSTPILEYLKAALIFLSAIISVIILLRKN
jgi:hypothetical protein